MPSQSLLATPEQTGYDNALADIRDRLGKYIVAVWAEYQLGALGATPDPVIGMIAQTVLAAQLSAGNLTSVYFAQKFGRRPSPVIPADIANREGGVTKADVYARAFRQQAFNRQVLGKTETEASEIGLRRLQNAVDTDFQMAAIRQGRRSMRDGGRKYYRRVPTGRESCAMCLIAATQRYKVENLLPIHPACDCRVDELEPGMDLDQVIDPKMLEDTHQQVKAFAGIADRGGRMPDYRELIITHEHGEIGPVIAWRNHDFTGPGDLQPPKPRPSVPKPAPRPAPGIVNEVNRIGINQADATQLRDYLTAKHGLQVDNFTKQRNNIDALRQYSRAVDDILTKYPQIKLEKVSVGDVGANTYAWAKYRRDADRTLEVRLGEQWVRDPKAMDAAMSRNVRERFHPSGFEHEPFYATIVHELGHALDTAGMRNSRRLALATVREVYDADTRPGKPKFADWIADRANLPGYSVATNRETGHLELNEGEAIAEAFADVELNGDAALPTSKALHKLLVAQSTKQ
ncbi:hypothetical protein [Mycolicibacterium sphagni]|uniref:Phage head morphogenesis domain-containing protein n=1 Tax=Mycolicibacterium sphagni TaxID=1786 RepID=A0A255DLV3_9MYCO|nr:hypothetical protein [Mycolicibacterium sphagni]OYN80427.1 hypothetical protein CG716_09885 [Mycolicibacterium sphagni]